MKNYRGVRKWLNAVLVLGVAGMLTFAGCTEVDDTLGYELVPGNQQMEMRLHSIRKGFLKQLTDGQWDDIRQRVIQGGKRIIELRGRSSFQSPAYLSICMIAAAMGGRPFGYPAGVFVHNDRFKHILMAMETEITKDGISYKNVQGTAEENKALADSYGHLCKLRDEVISMGIIPPVEKWRGLNPHLK